ncbi:hypothetical protein A9X05_17475 [Mycobacterium sp. E3298]|nr:hypothetical protein A9X05_17475 [Mycobacterium sp. E3298]
MTAGRLGARPPQRGRPPVIAANRALVQQLQATNVIGQNTGAIAFHADAAVINDPDPGPA